MKHDCVVKTMVASELMDRYDPSPIISGDSVSLPSFSSLVSSPSSG